MRKRIIFSILCVTLSLMFLGGTNIMYKAQVNTDENQESTQTYIDVYLMAGQSNMAGTSRLALLEEKYQKEYPNVLYYNGGDGPNAERNKWVHVRPGQGVNFYENGEVVPMFGPELGMASVLSNSDSNKKVAFIKYAYGGTAIFQNPELNNNSSNRNNWHGPWDGARAGNLYTSFLNTVRSGLQKLTEMGYTPVVKGLTWMQGETDGEIQFNNGKYNAADVYEHNLTQLFEHFRSEISTITGEDMSEMPIVFGEIYEYSKAVVEVRKIVAAQKAVGQLPNNYLIETGDLAIESRVDDWHWNGVQEFLLGVRFGEKLYQLNYEINHQEYDDGYVE